MEFTKENWENAPEGARLEWSANGVMWVDAYLIGFSRTGEPVVDASMDIRITHCDRLRIILPKRKVTVKLWRHKAGLTSTTKVDFQQPRDWTLLGEQTFEIEGE